MKTLTYLEGGLVNNKMKQSLIPEYFLQSKQEPEVFLLKRKNISQLPEQKSLKLENPSLNKPSLQVPPSKLPSLSPETLSILNSLNLPKSTRSADDILNSVRPREKYSELLEAGRKLALPYKYKRLLSMQEYLDCSISTAKKRGYSLDFNTLKNNIEATYECFIDLQHLKQIKAIVPQLYRFSNTKKGIFVDFPLGEDVGICEIHVRNSIFKRKMVEVVKGLHREHLRVKGIEFDPDSSKTWHSSFDLHQVPDLPMDGFEEIVEDNEKVVENCGERARFARLFSLSALILKVFNKTKTPSLFLKSLVKRVLLKKKENFSENRDDEKIVVHDLTEISQILPNWVIIINTDSGPVIRCNRSISCLSHIKSALQSRYHP
jgi:hypothetical protein